MKNPAKATVIANLSNNQSGFFFAVLWTIRFLVEFLKEPQGEEKITLGILNTGQVLSIPLVIIGLAVMLYSKNFKYEDKF